MRDTDQANESFYLGGGFIAAGFRGAIGTMCLIRMGRCFLKQFTLTCFANGQEVQVTDTEQALQLAVRNWRDSGISYERWVPFIHIGV
jgi:hypothetical protein